MIHLFNRREVFLALTIQDLTTVCEKLDAAGIEYVTRGDSVTNPGRGRGTPGVREDYRRRYRVYVRKKDSDRATHILSR